MTTTNRDQAHTFLEALLGFVEPPHRSMLWEMPDKTSTWFDLGAADSVGRMADRAVELAEADHNVYVACTLTTEPALGKFKRIEAVNASGMVGLWADLDIADADIHKKFNLPSSEGEATELANSTGLAPTILVHSGHGLQAWWLFDEPWYFEGDAERAEAVTLAEGWHTTLRLRAAERNWTVDSTHDLARVMRVPGTLNLKREPVAVKLRDFDDGRRYSIDDLRGHMVDESYAERFNLTSARTYIVGDVTVDHDRRPEHDALHLLLDVDEKFDATWKRQRPDLMDQSASSYCMSLATITAQAGWDDQQIVDLMVSWRSRNGEDMKYPGWYTRTLSRARDFVGRFESVEVASEAAEELQEAQRTGDDEIVRERRRQVLDSLSQMIGYEVSSVLRYRSDPPTFALVTPTQTITFESSGIITNQNQFRHTFWGATGHMVPISKEDWLPFVSLLGQVWEDVDLGSEATEAGAAASWVSGYLAARPPTEEMSVADAARSQYPYIKDGNTFVFSNALRSWIQGPGTGERLTARSMGRALRQAGYTTKSQNYTNAAGERTSTTVWCVS